MRPGCGAGLALLGFGWMLGVAHAAPSVCGPSALGAPCALEGPATLPTHQGPARGLGNPVHLGSGHKYQRDTDALAGPAGLALEVVRHYNSADPRDVGLGPGWRLSYDTRVYAVGANWQVVQADGSRWVFHAPASPGLPCQPDQPVAQGDFYVLPAGGYRWRWPNGRELRFNAAGRLQQIHDPEAGLLRLAWVRLPGRAEADRLAWVQDPSGQVLHLQYHGGRLRRAVLPFGAVHYAYSGAGQLRVALAANGAGRLYVYEPGARMAQGADAAPAVGAAALSGVLALHQGRVKRFWSWDYNARGQVVRVHAGERGRARAAALHYPPGAAAAPEVQRVSAGTNLPPVNAAAAEAGPAGAGQAAGWASGWPGLVLAPVTTPGAATQSWYTPLTGWQMRTGVAGKPGPEVRWAFANGDQWWFGFDAEGRLATWRRGNAHHQETVTLAYAGSAGITVHHPQETRRHGQGPDSQQPHLQRVDIQVHRAEIAGMPAWEMQETLWRDAAGQVVRHALPEGGELRYTRHDNGALQRIVWHSPEGDQVDLYRQNHGAQVLANGLLVRSWRQGSRQWHAAAWPKQPTLVQRRDHDLHGRVIQEGLRVTGTPTVWRQMEHDAAGRLIAWRQPEGRQRLAWGETGERRDLPDIPRDPSGLPLAWQGWQLRYGADRRLAQALKGEHSIRYFYNAQGELIARASGAEAEQYLHLGHQRVARWRARPGGGGRVVERYVYAGEVPVALLRWQGSAPWSSGQRYEVITVHTDALGQPVALSDASRRIRWHGVLNVWGGLRSARGAGDPGWRLPGQWADPDVGWHQNHQRVYLPQRGHYLEPDPLGPAPVVPGPGLPTSALGYAAQQPRRWLDPTGLVLFAFDGTLQNLAAGGNVVQFAAAYRDAQAAAAGLASSYYRPGPGGEGWLDAALASSARQIVQGQWQSLLQHLMAMAPGADPVVIDLVGYSRGAALARHFANLVATEVRQGRFWAWDNQLGAITQCVDLRFVGLFDSVAQFGLLGSADDQFDFSVDPAWQGVSHAVALHERRGWFPLLSLLGPEGELPAAAIEQGFVGSHGDVGGGWWPGLDLAPQEAALSDVSLAWMLQQAQALGVTLEQGRHLVSGAWATLHDDRTPHQRLQGWRHDQAQGLPIPGVAASDRAVLAASGEPLWAYQGLYGTLGAAERRATEAFIQRASDWLYQPDPRVGQVDLAAYARWQQGLP